MALVYDTDKIREAARRMRRLSERLNSEAMDSMRRVSRYSEELQGAAAEQMEERIDEMRGDLHIICDDLEEISIRLRAFANTIEAADEKIAATLGGR